MTNEHTSQSPIDRAIDLVKEAELARLTIPVALSVTAVQRDIDALATRRRELNDLKRLLARSVAARDEKATTQFSTVIAELEALDLDEEVLKAALESLREEERCEQLRANAAEIDGHRRRAGEIVSEIIEQASEFERAMDHTSSLFSKLRGAEQSLRQELSAGKVGKRDFVSMFDYAFSRLETRFSGRHASTLNKPTDEHAKSCLDRFVNLPSVMDDLDV